VRRSAALWALLSATSGTGCLSYNDECQAVVDDPREVIGYLDEDVFIDKANARHANNALGQLAADAFLHSQDGTQAPAVLGLINGGGIRAEGVCITRSVLPVGPLKKGVLHEALPFDNLVLALNLQRGELRRVMEASVSALSREDQPITSPSGDFLDLAGGHMTVDCSKPGGPSCVLGQTCRVTALEVGGRDVLTGNPDETFRVALSRFVVNSGENGLLAGMDQQPQRNPVYASQQGGIDSRLAEQFMREHYDKRKGQPGLKTDPSRIKLNHCAVPARPAG